MALTESKLETLKDKLNKAPEVVEVKKEKKSKKK